MSNNNSKNISVQHFCADLANDIIALKRKNSLTPIGKKDYSTFLVKISDFLNLNKVEYTEANTLNLLTHTQKVCESFGYTFTFSLDSDYWEIS